MAGGVLQPKAGAFAIDRLEAVNAHLWEETVTGVGYRELARFGVDFDRAWSVHDRDASARRCRRLSELADAVTLGSRDADLSIDYNPSDGTIRPSVGYLRLRRK